jgi:hypothetical protein
LYTGGRILSPSGTAKDPSGGRKSYCISTKIKAGFCIIVAACVYHLPEKPIRDGGQFFASRSTYQRRYFVRIPYVLGGIRQLKLAAWLPSAGLRCPVVLGRMSVEVWPQMREDIHLERVGVTWTLYRDKNGSLKPCVQAGFVDQTQQF